MKEKGKEIERAKEVLSKMDPELAVMAIRQSEVDFSEVNKIKDFLGKCKPEAVKYAIAELQQAAITKEIDSIKQKLKTFDLEVLKAAAVELGFAAKLGLCIDYITCRHHCIQLMVVRCMQDMYAVFKPDQLINPEMMEGIFGRAAAKASALAKIKGEL